MQGVIGAYPSSGQAARAVRELERQLSIQGVVVMDRRRVAWRKVRPDSRRFAGEANFLVVMIGDDDEIERARALLQRSGRVGAEAAPDRIAAAAHASA